MARAISAGNADLSKAGGNGQIHHQLSCLYDAYLSDPSFANEYQLTHAAVTHLKKKIYRIVRCDQSVAPSFLSPMTFADDALNLALAKFGLNARALRDARGSGSYLKSISGSAVFEERRQITRRSKQGPYYWEPIEKPNPEEPEGTAINILDFESSRQAAERYLSFSPCFQPDGKRLEHHDIVEKLLHDLTTSSCGREREAAKWLRLIVEHDATIEEIAMLGGITESAARNRLKTAKRKMHELAITRYKFTRGDL